MKEATTKPAKPGEAMSSRTLTVDAELEKLLAAFMEASEFDATTDLECEIEIGGWKTSYKPFSSDNNLNVENSNVKVWVDAKNNRWGGEYTVADGMDVNAGPFTGEVSVKVWGDGEIGSGKMANYGIEAEGKVGVGKETAIGGAACYFGTASYKFKARTFASALTR